MAEPTSEQSVAQTELQTPKAEYLRIKADLLARLKDEKLVPHEKDRQYIVELLQRIERTAAIEQNRDPDMVRAIQALDLLVPRRENGLRKIADRRINPKLESIITSRIDSKEKDVTSPEGSWGSLPESVRTRIIELNELIVEVTNRCTVQCHFCAFADKGAISEKMSFNSLLQIFREWSTVPSKQPNNATTLYWGTDPFDARWATREDTDQTDLDYLDIAEEYWKILGSKQPLLTSTAVPIGEELRILAFADTFLRKTYRNESGYLGSFRMSKTEVNAARVDAINAVLNYFYHVSELKDQNVYAVTSSRDDNVARAGEKAWSEAAPTEISTWDIFGPNCMDNFILRTTEPFYTQMVASSSEMPKGELQLPLREEVDGAVQYIVPVSYSKPRLAPDVPLETIYPDLTVSIFTEQEGGELSERQETFKENPHRAFLRLMSVIEIVAKRTFKSSQEMMDGKRALTAKETAKINLLVNPADIETMRTYLDAGSENEVFNSYFAVFDQIQLFIPLSDQERQRLERQVKPIPYYVNRLKALWQGTGSGRKKA